MAILSLNQSREYVKITVDYPVAAAKAFAGLADYFKFVYVSGEDHSVIGYRVAC